MIYFLFATAIASVFTVVPFIVAPSRVDLDKSSAYECGFDAFGDSRQTFSVSFYLVAIMYLLFDIEVRARAVCACVILPGCRHVPSVWDRGWGASHLCACPTWSLA